jgi:hypothetical protein
MFDSVMKQNVILMEANARHVSAPTEVPSNTSKKFKMSNQKQFCGGSVELEILLSCFRSNFRVDSEHFPPGDIDNMQYTLNNLGSWSNHPEQKQRKTSMSDPTS